MENDYITAEVQEKVKKIKKPKLTSNSDGAWKDILQTFFKEFIEFFCPDIYKEIEWEKGFEFLDKEFQSLVKHEKKGKRLTDKLVKVWRKGVGQTFLMIHIEVQDGKEIGFSLRMYNYYYRIWDRYKHPVMCLAVLLDKDRNWRPNIYEIKTGHCHLKFQFPVIKLIDYESKSEMLENSENPFALVVTSQLAALKSKNNIDLRKTLKFNLAKNLFKRGWEKHTIIALLKFIDGILRLPEQIELELVKEIKAEIKGEPNMSYVTSFEYFAELKGIEKGKQQGIQKGEARILISQLIEKFKVIPQKYKNRIENANPDILLTWANRLLKAQTIEEVFE